MPKYRLLTGTELLLFEKEFINYLVVNGITASDWTEMKRKDIDAVNNITALFSDVIMEKVLRKAQYIDMISDQRILCFHYQTLSANMMGMESASDTPIMNQINAGDNLQGIELLHASKKYNIQREIELFKMIEKGAIISDGSMYRKISLLMAEKESID